MKRLLPSLALALGFVVAASPAQATTTYAATKYPLVFAHGMAGFDNIGPLDYWYGIPTDLTNNATSTAVFTVSSVGGLPLTFQWLKNGLAVEDGGSISITAVKRRVFQLRVSASRARNAIGPSTANSGSAKRAWPDGTRRDLPGNLSAHHAAAALTVG